MLKSFKSIIKYFLNIIVNLFFLILNIILICFNILKILRAEIIIIQNKRIGFGNIFTSIDLSRKIYKNKKILFILFFDKSRFHNKLIYEILHEKKIILYSSLYIKFRKLRLGEYDNYSNEKKLGEYNNYSSENKYQNIIIYLIKKISPNLCKVLDINEIYKISFEKFSKKNKSNIFQEANKWLNSYFHLVKKNKLKINFGHKKIKKFLEHSSHKSVCLYFRNKTFINDTTKNFSLYKQLINFLYKKNFKIYLTGEIDEYFEKYPSDKKKVLTPIINGKFNDDKNLIMQIASKYFIGPSGGGAWFAMYKRKSVVFGQEECFDRPNVKSFKYQLYFKKKLINRKSKFYKNLKMRMIIDDDVGHPLYLKKLGINIKNVRNKVIIDYVKRNFI